MPTADEDLQLRIDQIAEVLPEYQEDLSFAFRYRIDDPRGSLSKTRLCTERLIIDLYREIKKGSPPQKGDPVDDPDIQRYLGPKNKPKLRWVREICNSASHVDDGLAVEFHPEDARDALDGMCDLLDWRVQDLRVRGRARSRSKKQGESSEPGLRAASGPLADGSEDSMPSRRRMRRSYGWWVFGGLLIVGGGIALSLARSSGQEFVRGLLDSTGQSPTSSVSDAVTADSTRIVAIHAAPEAGASPSNTVPRPAAAAVIQATRVPVDPATAAVTDTSGSAEMPPTAGPDDADWTSQNSQTQNSLYAVTSDPDGRVYAVGDQGLLLVTTDGGRLWRRLQTDTTVKLFAVAAFSGGGVFAVGDAGTIVEPRGKEARALSFSGRKLKQAFGSPLWAAHANSPQEWFVGGGHGTLVQIQKHSSVEKRLLDDTWSGVTIHSLTARNEGELYASGDRGVVLRGERITNTPAFQWSRVVTPEILETDTFWQAGVVAGQLLLIGGYESGAAPDSTQSIKRGLILRSGDGRSFHREIFASKPINPLYSFIQLPSGDVFASAYVQKVSYGIRSMGWNSVDVKWEREEVRLAGSTLPIGKYALGSSKFGDLFMVGPGGLILHKRILSRSAP